MLIIITEKNTLQPSKKWNLKFREKNSEIQDSWKTCDELVISSTCCSKSHLLANNWKKLPICSILMLDLTMYLCKAWMNQKTFSDMIWRRILLSKLVIGDCVNLILEGKDAGKVICPKYYKHSNKSWTFAVFWLYWKFQQLWLEVPLDIKYLTFESLFSWGKQKQTFGTWLESARRSWLA